MTEIKVLPVKTGRWRKKMKTYKEIKEIYENTKVDELLILESEPYGLTDEEIRLYAYVYQKEQAYLNAKDDYERALAVKDFDLDGSPLY
jgi:hypothetical protein